MFITRAIVEFNKSQLHFRHRTIQLNPGQDNVHFVNEVGGQLQFCLHAKKVKNKPPTKTSPVIL